MKATGTLQRLITSNRSNAFCNSGIPDTQNNFPPEGKRGLAERSPRLDEILSCFVGNSVPSSENLTESEKEPSGIDSDVSVIQRNRYYTWR